MSKRCEDCTHHDFPTPHGYIVTIPAGPWENRETGEKGISAAMKVRSSNNYCDKAARRECGWKKKDLWEHK